jgi:hypothetical protein
MFESRLSGNNFFEAILEDGTGRSIKVLNTQFKSGGCINNALKLITTEGEYFLKWQTDIPQLVLDPACGRQVYRGRNGRQHPPTARQG